MAIRSLSRGIRILSRFAFRMTGLFVIAVRVSGGHLCEAKAPTEPTGETRAPAAIRSFLRVLRILSRFALRMTSRLVVANTIRRADKLSFSCHCEAV